MEKYIKVVPVGEARVVHPTTLTEIPKEGQKVRAEAYWDRMKKQGVVTFESLKETPQITVSKKEEAGQ